METDFEMCFPLGRKRLSNGCIRIFKTKLLQKVSQYLPTTGSVNHYSTAPPKLCLSGLPLGIIHCISQLAEWNLLDLSEPDSWSLMCLRRKNERLIHVEDEWMGNNT